jgi:hypothetical protein
LEGVGRDAAALLHKSARRFTFPRAVVFNSVGRSLHMFRKALLLVSSGLGLLLIGETVLAFQYNAYDIHSHANCIEEDGSVVCDIRNGSDGKQSNTLSGVIVFPNAAPVNIKVCVIGLLTDTSECMVKNIVPPLPSQVVFETTDLWPIRAKTPWYNFATYIEIANPNPSGYADMGWINGYKAFWNIPK